jgi:5'-nucleotidase
MRFLLTNDDGIDAPGIAALRHAAQEFGQLCVVAPLQQCSGTSHQVSTSSPIKTHPSSLGLAVDAWPVDCVRVALRGLGERVDWVLSGINAGGNLGADSYISGTIAAVREGVLLGVPGIAFSCYKKRELAFDWPRASRWAIRVLREILKRGPEPRVWWNVNFPHLAADEPEPEMVFCPLDPNSLPVSYRREGDLFIYNGDYHRRPREEGSDVEVCMKGQIAISRMQM